MTAPQCDRSRTWVSLRLDGALSEFESALLERHLACCAACSTFALEAEGFTRVLRSAELEPTSSSIVLPSLGGGRRFALAAGAAAAAAVAAAAIGVHTLGSAHQGNPPLEAARVHPAGLALIAADGGNLGVKRGAELVTRLDAGVVRGSASHLSA
jgi:Putative zinc-finger